MERVLISNTNLSSFLIIMNGIISFQSLEDRRPIHFILPTIRDSLMNTDFLLFMSILYSEPEHFKNLKLNFSAKNKGELLLGFLITENDYRNILCKYFLKYILNSELKADGIYIDDQKIASYELEYIANVLLISMGYKKIEDLVTKTSKEDEEEKKLSEVEKRLLERQRIAEEKLRKAKERRDKNDLTDLTQEKIMLAVMHEFNLSIEDLKNMNYYAIS